MPRVTITQLRQATGNHVRCAAASRTPVIVTDRGEPVAILANPSLLKARRRKRTLLPEYKALMAKKPRNDLLDDLNAVRGGR